MFGGEIRDMWEPTCYGLPETASHPYQTCDPDDNGGVHSGNAIPCHAFAMMTDGKSFNGYEIRGIGPIKAGAVWYRTLTTYLTPVCDFVDAYHAINQAAIDLTGTYPRDPRTGQPSADVMTADDARQVRLAMLAVGMDTAGRCGASNPYEQVLVPAEPPPCGATSPVFADDFEHGNKGWTISNSGPPTAYDWALREQLPFERPGTAWFAADRNIGDCSGRDESGVHTLTSPVVSIPETVLFPTAWFTHYVATEQDWDGGAVYVSVNGQPWQIVPSTAFTLNPYNSALASAQRGNTNPRAGSEAWTGAGGTWATSVIDLSSLVAGGDTVQFRFELSKDGCGGLVGWYLDDFAVADCTDCNDNQIADYREMAYTSASGPLGPVLDDHPQEHRLLAPPPATSEVTLKFHAFGQLGQSNQAIDVAINGTPVGRVFAGSVGWDCTAGYSLVAADRLTIDAATFNNAMAGGDVVITMSPTSGVVKDCPGGSFVSVIVRYETQAGDCNANSVLDACDVIQGSSQDCNGNQVPDECEPNDDCNGNNVQDICDIASGTSTDCNSNQRPDDCDLVQQFSRDCNANGIPDECEFVDCNSNCAPDEQDIATGASEDCDTNGYPDECDLWSARATDCNGNGVPDSCDLANGDSADCNANQQPDECDIAQGQAWDCNSNGVPDDCDVALGSAEDCNANTIPDECDIAVGASRDCQPNNVPDECEMVDCNSNCIDDQQELYDRTGQDCNHNGVLDSCDINSGVGQDVNQNGQLDQCEKSLIPGFWVRLIARQHQAAPRADLGVIAGVIGRPAINNHGQVAFVTQMSGRKALMLWTQLRLDCLVAGGEPMPQFQDSQFRLFGDRVWLTEQGQVVFYAELVGKVDDWGLFIADESGVEMILQDSRVCEQLHTRVEFYGPSGGWDGAVTEDGEIYLPVKLKTLPEKVGKTGAIIHYANGQWAIVLASLQTVPGLSPSTYLGNQIAVADHALAFSAQLWGMPTFSDKLAAVVYRNNQGTIIARQGEPLPGVDGRYDAFDEVAMISPFALCFSASLLGDREGHAIFKSDMRGRVQMLVASGDHVPGSRETFDVLAQLTADQRGQIWFAGAWKDDHGKTNSGLYRTDRDTGRVEPILAPGQLAPTTLDQVVRMVHGFSINRNGNLAVSLRTADMKDRVVLLERITADVNHDGNIDRHDCHGLADCLTGPNHLPIGLCNDFDLDRDADVDLHDFALLQYSFIPCYSEGDDCNANGIADWCEFEAGTVQDCNHNGTPDECDIVLASTTDCNGNWVPDFCDLDAGNSRDRDHNNVPDECQGAADCNSNGEPDFFDLQDGTSSDCNANGIPDECDLAERCPEQLYWVAAEDKVIRRSNLDGSNIEEVVTGLPDEALGLAVDLTRGHMYWSSEKGGIERSDLDGNYRMVAYQRFARDLVLDESNHLYFSNDDGIYRANVDSPIYTCVVDDGDISCDDFGSIALDLVRGRMYWPRHLWAQRLAGQPGRHRTSKADRKPVRALLRYRRRLGRRIPLLDGRAGPQPAHCAPGSIEWSADRGPEHDLVPALWPGLGWKPAESLY